MGPSGIDMSPILAALQRRQQGQLGGGGVPAVQQQMPAAPTQSAPQQPMPQGMPQQVQAGGETQTGALQAGQKAQGPVFDEETRVLAKSLVQRLLKGI